MGRFIIATFIIVFLVGPAYPMTVEEAVQCALTHNPDLQVLRLDEDTALGQVEKARLLLIDNPTIDGNIARKDRADDDNGSPFTNFGFKLSQEFEVAGQRSSRISVAECELARARAGIKDRERLLIANTKDAFTKVLALRRKDELARGILQLKEELHGYTKIKFQAGEISSLDVNLSAVELSKAKRELLLLGREYREALLVLQGVLGLAPDKSFVVQGDLPSESPVLPDKEALKTILQQRPDVRATLFEIEKTQSAKDLVQKGVIPNVTLSGFYDRDERRNVVGMEVSLPLPFFDRRQAERREAQAKAREAKIKSAGLIKTIEREIELAFSDLTSAVEELTLFEKEIIAKARENLNLLNLAFKEGKVGFFEVQLAQKDTIEAQFAYIDAQMRTQLALNAIEKTAGGALK